MAVDAQDPLKGQQPAGQPLLDRQGHDLDLVPIARLLERLTARWRPTQVWLFGSRARGEATEASDWDLLVIVPDDLSDEALDPLEAWQIRKYAKVRADLIPCHERDFHDDRNTPNTLAYESTHRGVLIYER